MWQPISHGIWSAMLPVFLTGDIGEAPLNSTRCLFGHCPNVCIQHALKSCLASFVICVRFGKADPRNAALKSAMDIIGKEFKKLHR